MAYRPPIDSFKTPGDAKTRLGGGCNVVQPRGFGFLLNRSIIGIGAVVATVVATDGENYFRSDYFRHFRFVPPADRVQEG
jgi:hypothetical protein